MLYTERITGYIKKTLRYQRNRKADARKLMHRSEEIQKHQKAGQKAYQYGSRCGTCRDSDLWHNPQELRISVHIPICLAMCSDSRAVRQKEAYDTVVDNGKGGTTVTMPSRENMWQSIRGTGRKLVEPYVEDLNITRKIGDYTLTIINNISDGNAGVLSLKLENPNGIKAIHADEGTNGAKGAYFTQDRDFYFYLEGADESLVADKMTIDSKRAATPVIIFIPAMSALLRILI